MVETLVTFKAGKCELDNRKVRPDPTQGWLYLTIEEEMLHFCWRPRSAASTDPEIDLIMFPGDCTFLPYLGPGKSADSPGDKISPTNGRIFELKFSSSSQRLYFWLQSKSQHREGNPSWFSRRDLLLGKVVNQILAGDEEQWRRDLAEVRRGGGEGGGASGASRNDDAMEDVRGQGPQGGSGGAGAGATGGDIREEGEEERREGGDGARANDASDVVQNFLRSLQGSNLTSAGQPGQGLDTPFTTLTELFNTDTTLPYIQSASPEEINRLCSHLPPSIFLVSQESADSLSATEPTPEAGEAAIAALSTDQKREILARVLRSPQLHQSLGSLTVALRDGGLPQISEALGIEVENGGLIRGGTMPLGGGAAVEGFLKGIEKGVQKDMKK